MKPAESSVVSACSRSSVSRSQVDDLRKGSTSKLDHIFPMIDEMLKLVELPSFVYYLIVIYVTMQLFSVSLWPGYANLKTEGTIQDDILNWFLCISFITDDVDTPASYQLSFIIVAVITVVTILVFSLELAVYSKIRRFTTWSLYIVRFFLEFCPLVLTIPIANYLGRLFLRVTKGPTTSEIVFFVITIFFFAFCAFLLYVQSSFFAVSPYIATSVTACWDGGFQFGWFMVFSGCTFASYVVQLYGSWLDILIVCLKLLYTAYVIYKFFLRPYVRSLTNAVMAAVFTSGCFLDIMCIIETAYKPLNNLIHICVTLALLIIFIIVYNIVFTKRDKKAIAMLMESSVEETTDLVDVPPQAAHGMALSDPAKRAHFTKMGLASSSAKCLYYLRIGLAFHCDLFLDWSLVRFVSEFHDVNQVYAVVTQYLTFFPGESRMLRVFQGQLAMRPGLSYPHRFLIYEVHGIIGLRQSSYSNEVTDKLLELKRHVNKGNFATQQFWQDIPNTPQSCYLIRSFSEQTCALFREACTKWPNNSRIAEEYSAFLIECCTDFSQGVKQKHISNLIEHGKNFMVDYSFRSLVAAYPEYIKKGYVDLKGVICKERNARTNKGNSSQGSAKGLSQMSSGTIDGELEIEIEEEISRQIFSMHRLRLAFQRALEGRRPSSSTSAKIVAIVSSLVLIGLLVFLFVYYSNLYVTGKEYMDRVSLINSVRYGYNMALSAVVLYWERSLDIIKDDLWKQLLVQTTFAGGNNSLTVTDDLRDEIVRWTQYSRRSLEKLLSEAVVLAADGEDVRNFMGTFWNKNSAWDFCNGTQRLEKPLDQSLQNVVSFVFLRLRSLARIGAAPATEWDESRDLCEVFSNIDSIVSGFEDLQNGVVGQLQTIRNEIARMNTIISIAITCSFALIFMPLMIIFLAKYGSEIKKVMNIMKNLDDQTRKTAARSIRRDKELTDGDQNGNESIGRTIMSVCFAVCICVFMLLLAVAVLIAVLAISIQENDKFFLLNEWLSNGSGRGPYVSYILTFAFLGIALYHKDLSLPYTNWEYLSSRISSRVTRLMQAHDALLKGTNVSEGCVGANADIDNYHFGQFCDVDADGSFHDSYRCSAIDSLVISFKTIALELVRVPDTVKFVVDSPLYHMFHISNVHLFPLLGSSADLLLNNADIDLQKFTMILLVVMIVGIVYAVISACVQVAIVRMFDTAYDGALQLLRRVPPTACSSNPILLNFLMRKKSHKVDESMTSAKSVIFQSGDSVLCLNRTESIEVVNQAVTALFGYTPEQLLGQNINCLLPEELCPDLFQQFQLMRDGQCAMVFETEGIGKTDDDQDVPIHINLLGIAENGEAKSFAVIIRDETEVQKQKAAAEEAKRKSEELLYQILPRDIVTRLNSGETDISFVVPSASIIFIDIVRWSDYSATLTPSQIMENLSMIFAKFDVVAAKYPLLTKIKLIGDVYMAASGLFSPEEPEQNHASQTVQFGLDCLSCLEEANAQLESSLQVRIGINTGGPLIAGVLGTDKPTFDIIGDPINVSARLQSTCIPSTIQISEGTYNAISDLPFNIEHRGEVELKGKGKKKTYIVRPTCAGSFMFSSIGDSFIGKDKSDPLQAGTFT